MDLGNGQLMSDSDNELNQYQSQYDDGEFKMQETEMLQYTKAL